MKITTLVTVQMTDTIGEYLLVESRSFEYDGPIDRCDRSAQKQAGNLASTTRGTGAGFGSVASGIGSSLIPGLEQEAKNPTGFTPTQKNDMLVSGAEAIGGVNSGIKGEANLASARTRNAGGFAPALDEAARIKSRQLGTNALNVSGEDARLAQEKQRFAQGQLGNLYQGLNADQLKAYGLSDEDINTQIKAGQSGWQQNAMGWINAFSNAGKAAASDKEAFG